MIAIASNQVQNSGQIDPKHWQEWLDSGVSPEIISANVETLSGNVALQTVLYVALDELKGHAQQYATKPVRNLLERNDHIARGGWWCSGLEFFKDDQGQWQQRRMEWGSFKPDNPRLPFEPIPKPIKYEHPPKTPTRVMCLEVPSNPRLWLHCLATYTVPIFIVEGGKKAGCLLTYGYIAIALPGIFNGAPKASQDLIEELKQFAVPGRKVYICFDHDQKPNTIRNVGIAISRLGRRFSAAGCSVKVISLPGPEKGVDDFIVARGIDAFRKLVDEALPLEAWQVRQYRQLSYGPALILNQRYLGVLPIPDDAHLIGIKSPKGSGKTETLVPLVKEAIGNGQWVLLIGHRIQLVQAICERVGLPYVTEIRNLEIGAVLGYGLCIDSLHPKSQAQFSADGWNDGLVILDESEQVIWHTLSANTDIKHHRVAVIHELRRLLGNVLSSQHGRVVLSDADLSDLSIDFVKNLAGVEVVPWIVVNEWKPEIGWNVYHYNHSQPNEWLAALIEAIERGNRPLIMTQAQQDKSRWGSKTLEGHLRKLFPDRRILRIDSKTVADPSHAAYGCISKLNEVLPNYDIVIATPSIETGVSIDLQGHFSSVWGCFLGVTPENSARQALARLREGVDRHVWIASIGAQKIGNGSINLESMLGSQEQLAKVHRRQLLDAGTTFDGEVDISPVALNTWGKMACRINAGLIYYRQSVLDGLRSEGHRIIEVVTTGSGVSAGEQLTQTRDTLYQAETEAIASADDIDQSTFEKLAAQRNKTPDEYRQERKHQLKYRYQVEVTPELVAKDDQGWHPKLRLHYYLTLGRAHLAERDRRSVERVIHQGKVWLPDFNRSLMGARIGALELLKVKDLIDPSKVWTGANDQIIEIVEYLIENSATIRAILGLSFSPKDLEKPMQAIQRLLGKLGLRLTCIGRDGRAGPRLYRFEPSDDGRELIFKSWLERDTKATEKRSLGFSTDPTPCDPTQVNIFKCNSEVGSPQNPPSKTNKPSRAIVVGSLVRRVTDQVLFRVKQFGTQAIKAVLEGHPDADPIELLAEQIEVVP